MAQNIHMFIMADKQKVLYVLSNGAVFNDLQWPRPPVWKSRHSVILNISVTLRDSDTVSMEYYQLLTHARQKIVSSNHLEW